MRRLLPVLLVGFGVAGSTAVAGELVGTARWSGPPPVTKPIVTTKDRSVCGDEVEDESLLVTQGRLANVVVTVKGAPAGPPRSVTLDQQRCRYRPHVQAVPPGSTLVVTNQDELLHSVHGWAGRATRFDIVTPSKGVRIPTKLDRPGVIQVRCDVHAWMSAVVVVTDGPAAVTGPDGTFELRDLPAGSYDVAAWHERLGEKTVRVTVPASGPVALDLTWGP